MPSAETPKAYMFNSLVVKLLDVGGFTSAVSQSFTTNVYNRHWDK